MIMNKMLTVSIAAYNVEKYLDKCLASLADDRLNDTLEVLIVNDGSTDHTSIIAEKFVNKYPNIFKLINQKNGGHGATIMCGLKHAKGKYFRILDGDDWLDTENLCQLINHMKDLNCHLIVTPYYFVDYNSQKYTLNQLPTNLDIGNIKDFKTIFYRGDVITYLSIHSLTVKTDLLRENVFELLKHTFYEDAEFMLKATAFAKNVIFADLPIYCYLVGNASQSISQDNMVKKYDHHDRVLKSCITYYLNNKKNLTREYQQYVVFRISTLASTQFRTALICDGDRKDGVLKSKKLKEYIDQNCPEVWKYSKNKYKIYSALHNMRITGSRYFTISAIYKKFK